MTKKVMQCKPAPEIELVTEEGETITLRFNINMWVNLQEGENGLEALKELSVPETAALITYAAGKDINEGFTLEKARELIAFMDMQSVSEILNTFNESTGFDMEKLTDDQKKTILRMLRSTLM